MTRITYVITYRGNDGKFETVESPQAEWLEFATTIQNEKGGTILVISAVETDDGLPAEK